MAWWSPERDEELLRLRAERYSASAIASILGPTVSRNAVIGRLFRLGVSAGTRKKSANPRKPRKPQAQKKPVLKIVQPSRPDAPRLVRGDVDIRLPRKPVSRIVCTETDSSLASTPLDVRMMELTSDACRWPVNDPEPKGEYLFCGHPKKYGSYCAHHAAMSVGQGTFAEAIAHKLGWAA